MPNPETKVLLGPSCERCGGRVMQNWEMPGAFFTECPMCQLDRENRMLDAQQELPSR